MKTATNYLDQLQNEAISRAIEAGFFPAQFQRSIDWFHLLYWIDQVAQPGFIWRSSHEGMAPILISAGNGGRIAIHSGQHRILAGLMVGKPVPGELMETLDIVDPTRGWDEILSFETNDLLELLK